jgi:ABC-type Fe3+/spermidine/putrescine transport system ATPase subunit
MLSIRPECLRLSDYQAARNAIGGRLQDFVYLGEIAQYQINTSEGQEIRISELNPRSHHVALGADLFAVVDPEDVVILRS